MKAIPLIVLTILSLATALSAQEVAENARKVSWGRGWTCNEGYVERGNQCVILGLASDEEIRRYLVAESIASYSGNCPCPFNADRAGRRCGGRSAYSRPGGRSPFCYPSDITDQQVKRAREAYPSRKRPGA